MTVVVGIDPGGRQSGLVARLGDQLLAADLLTRDGADVFPTAAYLAEVVQAIVGLEAYVYADHGPAVIAVEGVVHPSGHVRMINAAGLLGTATVLGAILLRYPAAIVVPPAKHGAGPRKAYPARLWPPTETKGTGKHRHVRSAWDVAQGGLLLSRMQIISDGLDDLGQVGGRP